MLYALLFSVFLHTAATFLIIVVINSGTSAKKTVDITMLDIGLLPPAVSSSQQILAAPVVETLATPAKTEEIEPALDKSVDKSSIASDSFNKDAGMISNSLGLGMRHGYFSGLADGSSLREDIKDYYFAIVKKINLKWWDRADLLKEPLRQDGVFEMLIGRDGTIAGVRMIRETGSKEADQTLMEVIQAASPLPALPPTYQQDSFRAPIRIKMPSSLLRIIR